MGVKVELLVENFGSAPDVGKVSRDRRFGSSRWW